MDRNNRRTIQNHGSIAFRPVTKDPLFRFTAENPTKFVGQNQEARHPSPYTREVLRGERAYPSEPLTEPRRSIKARRMASVLVSWARPATSPANRSTSTFLIFSPMVENCLYSTNRNQRGVSVAKGSRRSSEALLLSSEVEPDRRRDRARRNVVRSAEGRKEIVERFFVGQIDHRQARAQFEPVAVKEVVLSHGDVEKIARCDAGRIVVVVFRAGRRNLTRYSSRIAKPGKCCSG